MILRTLQILKPLFNNLKQEKPILTKFNRLQIFKLFHNMTDEPAPKCAKSSLLIGTHDGKAPAQLSFFSTRPQIKTHQHFISFLVSKTGVFHCDEVLACFLLQQLDEYADSTIIRTRDLEQLKTCDIVVDVGGVFDKEKKRFDHHQR